MNSENVPIDEATVEVEDGHPVGYSLVLELSPEEAQLLDEAAEGRPPTEVVKLAIKQYALGQRFRRLAKPPRRVSASARAFRQFSPRAFGSFDTSSRQHYSLSSIFGSAGPRSATGGAERSSDKDLEAAQRKLLALIEDETGSL